MIHPNQTNHPQPRRPETRQDTTPLLPGPAAGAPPRQAAGQREAKMLKRLVSKKRVAHVYDDNQFTEAKTTLCGISVEPVRTGGMAVIPYCKKCRAQIKKWDRLTFLDRPEN